MPWETDTFRMRDSSVIGRLSDAARLTGTGTGKAVYGRFRPVKEFFAGFLEPDMSAGKGGLRAHIAGLFEQVLTVNAAELALSSTRSKCSEIRYH